MNADPARHRPAPASAPITRRSNGEEAAIHIRKMIFDGDLRPGERVPQDEIALSLGISRIPLREALIALQHQGWVTIELHRGAFVNTIDARTVEDHFELLGLMFSWALERAVERAGDAFVQRITEIDAALRAATDHDAAGQQLRSLYATLVTAADSSRLRIVLRATASIVPGDFFTEVPESIEVERLGLAAIVEALGTGDGARAGNELRMMLDQVCALVLERFDARGLFSEPRGDPAHLPTNRR